jgi:hypothetical protein
LSSDGHTRFWRIGTPSSSCSWWNRTVFRETAGYSFTGTLTSPKLIAPLQIARGTGQLFLRSTARWSCDFVILERPRMLSCRASL